MIFLHKLLPALLSPVSVILFCLIISFFTRRLWPRVFAVAVLVAASSPILAKAGWEYLEKGSKYRPISTVAPTDKVIVLGGEIVVVSNSDGDELNYKFGENVDRYEAAIELLKQDKAQNVIFTRGAVPWSRGKPEGEILAVKAVKRGINAADIILTREVQNTFDEAMAVKTLVSPSETPILVTSAFHMPRAKLIFLSLGMQVDAYPVGFRAIQSKFSVLDLMPSGQAFYDNSFIIRELLGRVYYGLKYGTSGATKVD